MCGRYTQTASLKELRERFQINVSDILELTPRYNIAPSQEAPVVMEDGGRALRMLRWGLIPSWAKDAKIGHTLLNARAETVAQKPSFRKSFQSRRCLVAADGFYEWQRSAAGGKTPMRAVLPSREPFALAGLWDIWKSPQGQDVRTFTIITTAPNGAMRAVHDRMPVILPRDAEEKWLDARTPPGDLESLLTPWAGALEIYAVSPLVNSPRNESAACAEPAEK